MNIKFENAYVYNTEKRCFEYGSLCFENQTITKRVLFPDAVIDAAGGYILPGFIDVCLDTSATRISKWAEEHENEGSQYIFTESAPTVRFVKPRANKETTDLEGWE